MRRTILFTAGLMMAAGASLALAGPASAAPKAPAPCCGGSGSFFPSNHFNASSWTSGLALNNVGSPTTAVSIFGGSATATNVPIQLFSQSTGIGLW